MDEDGRAPTGAGPLEAALRARTLLAGAGLALALSCSRGQGPAPASSAEIERLEAHRDALREKLAELRGQDANFRDAPATGVLIGVPVAFATDLIQQLTLGFLDRVEISLKGITIHKEGEVKTKTLLVTMKPGAYVLDVTLDDVQGVLKPGKATLRFEGNRIDVSLPVAVAEGAGRGTIRFKWDSQGVAGALCEDFEVTQKVSGTVAAQSYTVAGAFLLAVKDGQLEATPAFSDLEVNLKVEPSAESWGAVDTLLDERSFTCRTAMKAAGVHGLLRGLLDKGFPVKVPKKIIQAISLPAGLQKDVEVEGKTYALTVTPQELRVVSGVLWYGAEVKAVAAPPPPGAPRTLPR